MLVYQFKTVAYSQTARFIVYFFNDCKKIVWFRFKMAIFWSIYWLNLTIRSITILNSSVNKIWNSSQKWSCSSINRDFSFWNIISRTKLFVQRISSFCINRDSFVNISQYRSSIRQMKMFEIENDNDDNLHFFMIFDRILHFNFSNNNRNISSEKVFSSLNFFELLISMRLTLMIVKMHWIFALIFFKYSLISKENLFSKTFFFDETFRKNLSRTEKTQKNNLMI